LSRGRRGRGILASDHGIRRRRKAKSLDIALEVVVLVVSGLLNKQVGGEFGISEVTVKAYRAAR
jgi:FixJ family two-component response regulator